MLHKKNYIKVVKYIIIEDPQTRLWDFHIKDYDLLQNKLDSLKPEVVISKIPQFALNACKMKKSNYLSMDLSKIDQELLTALMPFQEEGVW